MSIFTSQINRVKSETGDSGVLGDNMIFISYEMQNTQYLNMEVHKDAVCIVVRSSIMNWFTLLLCLQWRRFNQFESGHWKESI